MKKTSCPRDSLFLRFYAFILFCKHNMKPIIYQVFTRLYGNRCTNNVQWGSLEENGTGKMKDFTTKALQRITDCGYTHIWYTGLLEHATQTDYTAAGIALDHPAVVKGRAGSPYAIKDYYDIDPDLAVNVKRRMAEFNSLVKRTHAAGLKMVVDFVPNHVARQYRSDAKPRGVRDLGEDDDKQQEFSPQNNFYYIPGQQLQTAQFEKHPGCGDPYVEMPARATGNDQFSPAPGVNDWYETVKLNYGVNVCNWRTQHFNPLPDTWKKMTEILLFWASKGIDAFRCDMAEMVPAEFWDYAIGHVKKEYPNILFIAEIYNPDSYHRYIDSGFDFLYDKVGLYDTLRAVICGQTSASAITGAWQSVNDIRCYMLNFLENHDEQRIASPFFAGNAEKGRPALVVSAMMGENPFMVYAGQEVGEPGMDEEGFSGLDGRTTIFDYWGVKGLQGINAADGKVRLNAREQSLYDYYRRVLTLCNSEEAIVDGKFYDLQYANYGQENGYNADRQFSFIRRSANSTILVVANFSDKVMEAGVVIPSHAFDFLQLEEGVFAATELLSGSTEKLELKRDVPVGVKVPAWNAVVFNL